MTEEQLKKYEEIVAAWWGMEEGSDHFKEVAYNALSLLEQIAAKGAVE